MIGLVIKFVAHHWVLATYFGTILLNESAILAAFSLSISSGTERYFAIAALAWVGVLTNDLFLFVLARYGLKRFFQENEKEIEAKTIFEKVFLHNTFISLLLMKFLFGMRIILTIYLIKKKRIPFRRYLEYNIYGIFIYILALGILGWLIGKGVGGALGTYHMVVRVVSVVVVIFIFTHFTPRVLKMIKKVAFKKKLSSLQ